MTELEAKVIRCYTQKRMTVGMMGTLGVCGVKKAAEILKKYKITMMRGYKDFDTKPK